MTVLIVEVTMEVCVQSILLHGTERIVQVWEMGGKDVVGERMESLRLGNSVPLFPNMIKALNRADQLVQFSFVLALWGMEFAHGQRGMGRLLKRQWVIAQVLVEFRNPKTVSVKSALVGFILLENKTKQLSRNLSTATKIHPRAVRSLQGQHKRKVEDSHLDRNWGAALLFWSSWTSPASSHRLSFQLGSFLVPFLPGPAPVPPSPGGSHPALRGVGHIVGDVLEAVRAAAARQSTAGLSWGSSQGPPTHRGQISNSASSTES